MECPFSPCRPRPRKTRRTTQAPSASSAKSELTESGIVQADEAAFDRLRSDYETEQHQLEFKYAKARYDLLKRKLDGRLDAAALDLEAKARGVTTETVLAELKTSPPTEEEVRAFYDQNQGPHPRAL